LHAARFDKEIGFGPVHRFGKKTGVTYGSGIVVPPPTARVIASARINQTSKKIDENITFLAVWWRDY